MLTEMDSKYGFARVENVSGGPFIMLPQVRYPPEQMESSDMEKATLSRAAKQFCESSLSTADFAQSTYSNLDSKIQYW